MADSITTEEDLPGINYYLSTASKAISSIFAQQTTLSATPVCTDYESIGSYEENTTPLASVKTMTLASNLESGEYESLEEWSAPIITAPEIQVSSKLIPVSIVLESKEPLEIQELRCRYERKQKRKERKVPLFEPETKSLKDLLPISSTKKETALSLPHPNLVPIQKKVSVDSKVISSSMPLGQRRRHEMIPIKTPLPATKTMDISASFKSTLLGDKPLQSDLPQVPFKMPDLLPLQRKSTNTISASPTSTAFNLTMPDLLPLTNKKSINSVKDMLGASFFGATNESPLGAPLGSSTKFDLGCGFRGDPIKCPRSYLEQKRPDLYKLWREHDTVPNLSFKKDSVVVLVPSGKALAVAIASYNEDGAKIKAYLQSHIVTVLTSELEEMEPESMARYPTELSIFEIQLEKDQDGNLSIAGDNRIPLEKTPHKQILLMAFDEDFKPPTPDEEMINMDGMVGNIKKRLLHTTGIKKELKPRKYESLVFCGEQDKEIWSDTTSDAQSTINIKIETHVNPSGRDFTINDSSPIKVIDAKTTVTRRGDLEDENATYTYTVRVPSVGKPVKLMDLARRGLSIRLRNLSHKKSSKKGKDGFNLPVTLKTNAIVLAFVDINNDEIKEAVEEGNELIAFKAVKDRGVVSGTYYLVFEKKGKCDASIPFNYAASSCGFQLKHITMVFPMAVLTHRLDYKTSFLSTNLNGNSSVKTEKKKDKKKKYTRIYTTLVYNMDSEEEWALPGNVDVKEMAQSDSNLINVTMTNASIDRVKHVINKDKPLEMLDKEIPLYDAMDSYGTLSYTVPLESEFIMLGPIVDKGLSLTLSKTSKMSLPKIFGSKSRVTINFAFSDRNDRSRLKEVIAEKQREKSSGNIRNKNNIVVFRAAGSEIPGGSGTYYFVFKRFDCGISTTSPLGTCEYQLSYIKMLFRSFDTLSIGSFGDSASSDLFEEFLHSEMMQRGVNLSLALSAVEGKNQFGEFVSMNGSQKLITALSSEIKSSLSELSPNTGYNKLSTVSPTTKAYDTVDLHTLLYDMNATHLPMRKQEITTRAQQIIGSLIERTGASDRDTKLSVLTNLDYAVDTFARSIETIRMKHGEL